jgi:hypothetical protein
MSLEPESVEYKLAQMTELFSSIEIDFFSRVTWVGILGIWLAAPVQVASSS